MSSSPHRSLPPGTAAGSVADWPTPPGDSPGTVSERRVARAKALGDYGERLAARHLIAQGLVVLDRNWRAPSSECVRGEIDLVLREGDLVVVCEVKTRSSTGAGSPHQAVDHERAGRLRQLGEAWLRAHPGLGSRDIRVDLVAVLRPRKGPSVLEHLRGFC